MRHLDLFSGIGGFSLAASWVWKSNHEIISFVEIDKFCQKVLKKHWPNVPIHDDIRTYKHDGTTIDLLTGGFPCQPFSIAGKQNGKKDNRYLWPVMLKIIQQTRPSWIIGENVVGFINMELENAISDLEAYFYEVEAFDIPACAVEAAHERRRIWIVAHSDKCGLQEILKRHGLTMGISSTPPNNFTRYDANKWPIIKRNRGELRNDYGIPNRVDRIKSLGNAIVPQVVVPIMECIKIIESNRR